MSEDNRIKEQWQLLQSLRSTVESLLNYGVSNVWNIYGGLNRLHSVVEQIFKHGSRIFDPMGEPDCWVFIQGLNWLQPSLAISPNDAKCEDYLANLPTRIASRKDILWLYKSLENHSLSQKLSWLLSDKEHLLSCLEPWAFLCQDSLAEATLICLRAVEKNQASLLTEIDPSLFLPGGRFFTKNSPNRHRRSASYPTNFDKTRNDMCHVTSNDIMSTDESDNVNDGVIKREDGNIEKNRVNETRERKNFNVTSNLTIDERENEISLKSWNSLPVLCKDHEICQKNCALPLTAFISTNKPEDDSIKHKQPRKIQLSDVIKIDYSEAMTTINNNNNNNNNNNSFVKGKKLKIPSRRIRPAIKSSGAIMIDGPTRNNVRACPEKGKKILKNFTSDGTKIENNYKKQQEQMQQKKKKKRNSIFSQGSTPEFSGSWSLDVEGQKDRRTPRKSFMEDGGNSVQPMATGFFPRPMKGESLTSFLSSGQFSRANAELDRENAHFSISEAMIAAIEQVKCNRQLRIIEENVDESDEEINHLKQRIRLRRHQRQMEQRKLANWSRELLSDGKTDTTTTDQSVSPLSSSPDTPSDVISTDGVDDLEIDDSQNLSQLRSSGVSVSMASLYSDADIYRSSPRQATDSALIDSIISAEGVALCLISRFSERQLPRASELQWLVSEQDAPQELLPMPKNWSADHGQKEEETRQVIPLRGTKEWAPPRPQIIFTAHPPPVKRILIAKQNYRCAGCGMRVAIEYANKFRYCEYLGRYFCTGCHANQVALIPGKILSKWDFNRYPVSNFSYRLLDQMSEDPLFQVNDLNPLLYRRIKQLERTRLLRTQLYYLKDFLLTCRFAQSMQEAFDKLSNYMFKDPHVYSLQDLMSVKSGLITEKLSELVKDCCAHVSECVLCEARGFVCELCCSKGSAKVIFPWELSKVTRCENCGTCFHAECKNSSKNTLDCPRCVRLEARRSFKE